MRNDEFERFRWAVEFRDTTLLVRPDLAEEVVDLAYYGLVDALLKRSDLGHTRNAVFALGRKQLGWRTADAKRAVVAADGTPRNVPAAAGSLDAPAFPGDAAPLSDFTRIGSDDPVVDHVLVREELREILKAAVGGGRGTQVTIEGSLAGYSASEIGVATQETENVVHQRKSRFLRAFRRDHA